MHQVIPIIDSKDSAVIGSLELWQHKKHPNGVSQDIYKRLYKKSFSSQVICVAWFEPRKLVALGCDKGLLVIQREFKFEEFSFETILSEKIHKKRIMGLVFNAAKLHLYSISRDKHLKLYNIETRMIDQELKISRKFGLTDIKFSEENQNLFIGDSGGNVTIVDTRTELTILHTICTGIKSDIRGLEFSNSDGYLFVSVQKTSQIFLYQLETPFCSHSWVIPLKWKRVSLKPRVLKFSDENQELYIGHANGVLSVASFSHGILTLVSKDLH